MRLSNMVASVLARRTYFVLNSTSLCKFRFENRMKCTHLTVQGRITTQPLNKITSTRALCARHVLRRAAIGEQLP
jgi:hypothetical protein